MFREFKVYASAVFLDCSAGKSHATSCLAWGATPTLQSIGVILPWGQCSAPLPWNIFGVCGFLVPRVHCKEGFVFPAARVAFLQLPVCIAWHEVLKGVRPPGMVWNEIGKDLTPPVCLRESFGTNLYGNSWLIPKGLEPPHTHMVQVIRDCWKWSKTNSLRGQRLLSPLSTLFKLHSKNPYFFESTNWVLK